MVPAVIASSGDLTVEIVEYDSTIVYQANQAKVVKKTVCFQVSSAVLAEHSPIFKRMLHSGNWKESGQSQVKLEERVLRIEVIFRVLHGSAQIPTIDIKEM